MAALCAPQARASAGCRKTPDTHTSRILAHAAAFQFCDTAQFVSAMGCPYIGRICATPRQTRRPISTTQTWPLSTRARDKAPGVGDAWRPIGIFGNAPHVRAQIGPRRVRAGPGKATRLRIPRFVNTQPAPVGGCLGRGASFGAMAIHIELAVLVAGAVIEGIEFRRRCVFSGDGRCAAIRL